MQIHFPIKPPRKRYRMLITNETKIGFIAPNRRTHPQFEYKLNYNSKKQNSYLAKSNSMMHQTNQTLTRKLCGFLSQLNLKGNNIIYQLQAYTLMPTQKGKKLTFLINFHSYINTNHIILLNRLVLITHYSYKNASLPSELSHI